MAGGNRRRNGLDANSRKSSSPVLMAPITPSTRATTGNGSCRLNNDTASDHSASIVVHSNIDPSCPPHTAATR